MCPHRMLSVCIAEDHGDRVTKVSLYVARGNQLTATVGQHVDTPTPGYSKAPHSAIIKLTQCYLVEE